MPQAATDHVLTDRGTKYRGTRVPALVSNWFGTIPAPKSFSQFCQIIESTDYEFPNMSAWRGQADHRWRVDSGAVRRVLGQCESANRGPHTIESVVHNYETRLINEARCRGGGWIPVQNPSDLEVLASLQHYGAATRLLDFSENAFVALWFACTDLPSETGLLIGIDRNLSTALDEYSLAREPLPQILGNHSDNRRLLLWRPGYLFDRMRVQQSLFLFNVTADEVWGSIPLRGGAEDPRDSEIFAVAITPELKGVLASKWEVLFGYSVQTLFPDIEGFARAHGARNQFPWDL